MKRIWFLMAIAAATSGLSVNRATGQEVGSGTIDPFAPPSGKPAGKPRKERVNPDGDVTVRVEWFGLETRAAWDLLREYPGREGGGEVFYRRVREMVEMGEADVVDAVVARTRPGKTESRWPVTPPWLVMGGGTVAYPAEIDPPAGTPQALQGFRERIRGHRQ